MTDVKTAAAIALWLESNPEAAKEVVRHLHDPIKLLNLRAHFPDDFDPEGTKFAVAFKRLDSRYEDTELVRLLREALVTVSSRCAVVASA